MVKTYILLSLWTKNTRTYVACSLQYTTYVACLECGVLPSVAIHLVKVAAVHDACLQPGALLYSTQHLLHLTSEMKARKNKHNTLQ